MNNFKLIREYTPEVFVESVKNDTDKNWYISGITLQSEIKNRNGRIYPKTVLSEAINKHVNEFMIDGRSTGELNHPTNGDISSINLDRVSHKFIEVKENGNDYVTKAQVLDTPCGKIVQNLLEGGVKLGISSRGLGKIKRSKSTTLIENLYLVSLGDIVSEPSAPSAFINGVLESVEYELTEHGFTVVECNKKLDKFQTLLKESSKEDIGKAVNIVISEYLQSVINN